MQRSLLHSLGRLGLTSADYRHFAGEAAAVIYGIAKATEGSGYVSPQAPNVVHGPAWK